MTINLQKGQTINLAKKQYDLSSVTVGLGWDVNEAKRKSGGILSFLFKKKEEDDFDLDAIAVLLNSAGKVADPEDVIFYNHTHHASGHIEHSGDERTGGSENEDDEQIVVNLNRLEPKYDRIVFLVTIYKGREQKQDFGQVGSAFIRAVDARGKEMFHYDLSNNEVYAGKCSMTFGELYRQDGGWKFRAIGTAYETDDFEDVLNLENFI